MAAAQIPRDEHNVLHEADAHALVRLLGQVAVLEGDTLVKKRHLMNGLAELINADYWMWNQFSGMLTNKVIQAFSILHNLPDDVLNVFIASATDASQSFPEYPAFRAMGFVQYTRRREDLVPDEIFNASEHVIRYRKPMGFAHTIWSMYPVAEPDIWSGLGMHRVASRGPFTPRDRFIVHLVMSEVDWLHRDGVDRPDAPKIKDLSPRLRQVLYCVLLGDNPKQIAGKLDLTEHTVRGYFKALYKRFDVASRGELYALFLSGGQRPPK